MRFPWLQVDSDFREAKAGDLGALLDISRREAIGLMVDLWAWVLTRSPDDRVPDGIISGTGAVAMLERAAEWTGERGRLVAALEELALLERLSDGIRLCGVGRYATTWKKNRGGKGFGANVPEKPGRNRPGPAPNPAHKTQTQTQKETTPSEGTDVGKPPPAPPLVLAAQEPEKPKRAPSPTALGEFIDWARAEVKPLIRPDAPDPAVMQQHQRIRLGEAVKAHGTEACKAAFRLWMGWTVAQEKGYPLGFFAAQWEQWVGQVKAPGARASPTQAVGRGAAQDGGECDGCGESQGYCAPVGPDGNRVRLGGACGCWTAWQGSGVGYADAPEWARNRRAGRVT